MTLVACKMCKKYKRCKDSAYFWPLECGDFEFSKRGYIYFFLKDKINTLKCLLKRFFKRLKH